MCIAKPLMHDPREFETDRAAYIQALSLLVQGMELHTLGVDVEDYDQFRASLGAIQESLIPAIPPAGLLVLVGQTIQSFEQYNQRAGARLRLQFQELRSTIATLAAGLANMASASDASLSQLREIQSHFLDAEKIDDFRALKNQLAECLKNMAVEAGKHRKNSASVMAALNGDANAFERSVGRTCRAGDADPVTGLPGRAEAEKALSQAVDNGHHAMAAVFVMKQLNQLSSRFGYQAGNTLLESLAAYLGSGAAPEGGLYRWSGTALLALFNSNVPLVRVRQKIRSLIGDMPPREIKIGARTVAIPVSVGWTVFPVCPPVERLFRQLEAFFQGQSAEDAYAGE